jgi:Domain of Unknown Function with PDB structure (DUF3857)/Transglutaminase-like superfamily
VCPASPALFHPFAAYFWRLTVTDTHLLRRIDSPRLYRRILVAVILALIAIAFIPATDADDWLPISPDDLKMTAEPKAPGAPAINLYRQVDRDDQLGKEVDYVRIKVLTDEGRKYGDVAIPLYKAGEQVNSIRARTIRPDGSIVNFDGKVYLAPLAKSKDVKIMAKTFTMPEVQVGSIIEYRYISSWDRYSVYDSRWILSDELYTKRAKFTLKPSGDFPVTWNWNTLPQGTNPPKDDRNVIGMESSDIPAFHTEDFMPPENELKSRVDFIYSEDSEKNPDKFWKKQGKKYNDTVESFINKRKAMDEAVAGIVSPSDTPEVKARKIYARVLQIHNTSMDDEKTEQEQKRDKQKEVNNVEEMWKRGYGNGRQVDYLFTALLRAAGIDASEVYLASRSEYFFNPKMLNARPLTGDVVVLKLNGKDVYCDPGSALVPFGLVPWYETGVLGLRLDKDGGSWITTAMPDPEASEVERKATLKATDDGSLEGKLVVTYTGLEAYWLRSAQRKEDAASRKKTLEDMVRSYVPVGIDVELTNSPDWVHPEQYLVGEFDLKVPGWLSAAGKRALVPVGLFSSTEKHIFETSDRVHPIYFSYPFRKVDDITIELPLDWKVSTVPPAQSNEGHVISYTSSVKNDNGTLHLKRQLDMNIIMMETKYYGPLRAFFQAVRTGDDLQIVVQPGASAARN